MGRRRRVAGIIAADAATAIAWSLLVGGSAPRWPDRWLAADRGPLRLTPWDQPAGYRRLGVPRLVSALPEGGAWLGGTSKASLPGRDADALRAYLIEVRRGEWVHLLSLGAALPLAAVAAAQFARDRRAAARGGPAHAPDHRATARDPVLVATAVALAVAVGNSPFLLILRYNRVRLTRILQRSARSGVDARETPRRA